MGFLNKLLGEDDSGKVIHDHGSAKPQADLHYQDHYPQPQDFEKSPASVRLDAIAYHLDNLNNQKTALHGQIASASTSVMQTTEMEIRLDVIRRLIDFLHGMQNESTANVDHAAIGGLTIKEEKKAKEGGFDYKSLLKQGAASFKSKGEQKSYPSHATVPAHPAGYVYQEEEHHSSGSEREYRREESPQREESSDSDSSDSGSNEGGD